MPRKALEKDIQRFVVKYMKASGFVVIRINNVRITGDGRFLKMPVEELGWPDCVALLDRKSVV